MFNAELAFLKCCLDNVEIESLRWLKGGASLRQSPGARDIHDRL